MANVVCNIDKLLERESMKLVDLASEVGITKVNLSVLKNNHGKAVRFTTLIGLCRALNCQPGDLFEVEFSEEEIEENRAARATRRARQRRAKK